MSKLDPVNWSLVKGYKMACIKGKTTYEHRLIWERENGPIPTGMIVHHKDGNPLNNSIGNLELMDRIEHHKMHSRKKAGGYELRDGIEHKTCRRCLKVLPFEAFYMTSRGSRRCYCKICCIELDRINTRKNKLCRP